MTAGPRTQNLHREYTREGCIQKKMVGPRFDFLLVKQRIDLYKLSDMKS